MSAEERALLEAFVVDNRDLERLESLLAEFNIFEALGVVRQELRHSDFLAFLLDPAQNHGLGDEFLKRLLKRALLGAANAPISAVEIDVADLRGAVVRREWQNIDILVHDVENRLVCAVENKIGSREHSNQLRRYRQIVAREYPTHRAILLYLTPEGDEPSDKAYIPFSYAEIATLVDTIRQARQSTLGPAVSTLLAHYSVMLRRYIVSDSETAELCRQIYRRHKQALDLIFEHRPDLQEELAQELRSLIRGSAQLVLDDSLKSYVRFAVADWDRFPAQQAGERWTSSRRMLLFVFANLSNELRLGLFVGPGPEAIRQAVMDVVRQKPDVFGMAPEEGKWIELYRRPFLKRSDYQDPNLEQMRKKLRREWDEFLARDLPVIREAIEGISWPEVALPAME